MKNLNNEEKIKEIKDYFKKRKDRFILNPILRK